MRNLLVNNIVLMLISPALGLFYGLRKTSINFKKWIITIFVTIHGSIMLFAPGADGERHLGNVYRHYLNLDFSEFYGETIDILLFHPQTDTNDDIYIHFVSFISGTVLSSPGLLFIIVSFVYGYLYASGLLKVLSFPTIKKSKAATLFLAFGFLFIMYRSVESINTVRTWTGAWMLFNGAFGYFHSRKRKYLYLVALSPFVHTAYFIMALPTVAVLFLGNKKIWYAIIFCVSFVFSFNQSSVLNQLQKTELGSKKAKAYLIEDEEERKERFVGHGNWYKVYGTKLSIAWGVTALAFLFLFTQIYFKHLQELEAKLFSAGILTVALANFSDFLYALNNRSMILSGFFIISSLVLFLKRDGLVSLPKLLKTITTLALYIIFGVFAIFLIYQCSNLLNYLSFYLLGFPFLPWFTEEVNFSLREMIGWVL